ncbi:hypothetical protein LTR10_017654 [Elasticomyces elasticus]|uniref:Uncharacterized protein n=1 Tax=Exophiala sideris TaxID=1016849 RepID=A0ABR0JP98_9EURO|nr:hypothetical protein LTR10_017654 [Elasticomyces elasticus]KAK5038299.1 hypothetical protein LTS07_001769 [Exophiala sideris]KAK5044283.1 hypothetical protein LTR13_000639 [Exophiala sideris]KAK5067783.1 hypothetical protein LTR69_001772 [Exophiala sideris]KAK5183977.1 hypothetical protein LTR44_003482 [Eurotiomycetes sp. CCFEE 6388]
MHYRGRERGIPDSVRPQEYSRDRQDDPRPSRQVKHVSFQSKQEETVTRPRQRGAHAFPRTPTSFERIRPEPPHVSAEREHSEYDQNDVEEAVARSLADVRAKELSEMNRSTIQRKLESAATNEAIARSLAEISVSEITRDFEKDRKIAALELELQVEKEKAHKVASDNDRTISELRIALQKQEENAKRKEWLKDQDVAKWKSLLQLESEKRDTERRIFEFEREAGHKLAVRVQPPTEPEVIKILEPKVRYKAPKGRELWVVEVRRDQGRLVECERRLGPNDIVFSRCKKP